MTLYELAMQVVPLLLIAAFLDSSQEAMTSTRHWGNWYYLIENRLVAFLGIFAFMTSLFVVAGIGEPNAVTQFIVITALAASITMLFVQIWHRVGQVNARQRKTGATRPE